MCFSYFVIEMYILLSLRKFFKKKLNSTHKLTFSERRCPCLFPVAAIKPWLKADSRRNLLSLPSVKQSQGRNWSRGQKVVMLTGLFSTACSACLFNTSQDYLPRGGTELSKFITNLKYVPQTCLRGAVPHLRLPFPQTTLACDKLTESKPVQCAFIELSTLLLFVSLWFWNHGVCCAVRPVTQGKTAMFALPGAQQLMTEWSEGKIVSELLW